MLEYFISFQNKIKKIIRKKQPDYGSSIDFNYNFSGLSDNRYKVEPSLNIEKKRRKDMNTNLIKSSLSKNTLQKRYRNLTVYWRREIKFCTK